MEIEYRELERLACHYTRLESALLILGSGTIRLSRADHSLNDPGEIACLPIDDGPTMRIMGLNDFQMGPLNRALRERALMLSLSVRSSRVQHLIMLQNTGQVVFPGLHGEDASRERSPYLINRMWAQYGSNHCGVCFAFDIDVLLQNTLVLFKDRHKGMPVSPHLWHWPVKYVTDSDQLVQLQSVNPYFTNFPRPAASASKNDPQKMDAWKHEFRQRYFERTYFTKTDDWRGEQEFRIYWFHPLDADESADVCVPIHGALKCVIAGARVQMVMKSHLRKLATEYGADFLDITVKRGLVDVDWPMGPVTAVPQSVDLPPAAP